MENLRARLKRPTFGAWISGDPLACEVMGRAGYDWLILETQHRALAPEAMVSALQAVQLGQTPTLVRVGCSAPLDIERALDIGAAGVIVPTVNTAAQARVAVNAMRYPPRGLRSYRPVRDYARQALEVDPISVLMIETVEAVTNLEEIAAVPEIDVLLIGPADLALSMGLKPTGGLEPPLLAAIDRLVEVCGRHNVVPGCASFGFEAARKLVNKGVRFISVSADGAFLRRGADEDGRQIAALHKELDSPPR